MAVVQKGQRSELTGWLDASAPEYGLVIMTKLFNSLSGCRCQIIHHGCSCSNLSFHISLFTLRYSWPHPHLPHLPLCNPWPKLKHAEQSRQVLSSRPEHSVLRVLTFHPGVNVRQHRSGPPSSSSAETGTQHRPDEPSCAASQRHAKKFSSRSRWENKQASDITADAETRRREKLVEVQGCRVWACYSGSRCQCRIVPLPVRASCQ